MGTLFKIAFRNILRNKRRTFTSALIIAVGLLFFIFMDSVMNGMDKGATDNLIQLSTSSVKIHTAQYFKEKNSYPFKYGLKNHKGLEEHILKLPEVTGVAPRIVFLAELSNYTEVKPVIGHVIDPAKDAEVFKLTEKLSGSYFSSVSMNEIILGTELAEEMGVSLGDYITFYALTKYDSRNADDFKVIGILKTTDPSINNSSAYITYQVANEFLDLENMITELNVSINKQNDFESEIEIMESIKSDLEKNFKGLKVLTFEEMAADFLNLKDQKQAWSWVFIIVILLIAAVGIFNTVLMSVYERIKEIGVLRAHGFKPFDLTVLFMLEGTITGILGSTFGVILGCIGNYFLVNYGYPIDKFAGNMDASGFPIWGTLYGQWNIDMIIAAFIFGIVVATAAAVIPARKAAKMSITDALRFV
ncbi:MAG: ABC transporter permease [Candidatus Delongbacteria bacterium]|nr:ABC transporter permease [Candidatus Delongbacteria bacterium]